ncbi:nSTAND1 domain-containing NTPase [Chitinimonas lacunae]|uniref:Winged helix-turn-helix domain-containing protein n=1 Tax=Chitinimonas lacunae TaxID=1963018 RepID=A0ABV8MLK2_9NEIS
MRNDSFRFGDWRVHPASNSLSRGETRHQVEPRAMDVLVALCRHANAVVSTEELLQQCWGGHPLGDNPVHKTITQLRRVLGDSATAPRYIETIRKRGYRTIATVVAGDGAVTTEEGGWRGGSPFRGLEAFDESHAAVFFGRADACSRLLRSIAVQAASDCAFQLVLGPSGSGKTSLIRAGILPALSRADREETPLLTSVTQLDLGDIGEQTLATALAGALLDWQIDGEDAFPGANAVALGETLSRTPTALLTELRWRLDGTAPRTGPRLGLFIDRLEALFTASRLDEAQRLAFLAMLETLARSGLVLVIAACRNDFYPRIVDYPLLLSGKDHGGHFDLAPPRHAEIAQIIRLPALAADLRFGVDSESGARLDDVLCEAAARSPDALPLLQYTLQELYRQRQPDGELSFDTLRRLGGMEGAIGQRAEEVIAALDPAPREALPEVLALVVAWVDDSNVSSRRAPWAALRDEAARRLVNALVENRLFVSELVGGEPGFGVAHEALLRRWPRAVAWIATPRSALLIRSRLSAQTTRWIAEGRPADLLLPAGKPLDEARSLLVHPALTLSDQEIDLIAASQRRVRRRERLRFGAMATILILSILTTVLGLSARQAEQQAQRRRTEAENLMGFMVGDFADKLRPLGRLDLLDSVSAKALEYLSASSDEPLSPTSQLQRAQALLVIGEVNLARGDPVSATSAFTAARGLLEKRLAADPRSAAALKHLGAVSFWLAQIQIDQNHWSQAEALLNQYRDYSNRLSALDPADPDAWIEQSYAYNSLGSLALMRDDSASAAQAFETSVALKTRARARKPDDATLAADLADSLSWLATAREANGDLHSAVALHQRQQQVLNTLHEASPGDGLWRHRLALALQHAAGLKAALGEVSEALGDYGRANRLLDANLALEPDNRLWQRDRLYGELERQRLLAFSTSSAQLLPALQATTAKLTSLTRVDPRNADWARLQAISQQRTAAALLALGRVEDARPYIAAARQQLDALQAANAEFRTRAALAHTLLTLARLETAAGQTQAARTACQQASELLRSEAGRTSRHQILDPWIQAQHCLDQPAVSARQRLTQIGYRDPAYLQAISTH